MTSLPPIKWPTGRTPSKVEIFAHQHKGGRVALHVVELDTKLIYPAFLLEDMTGHWNSAEGWRSNPFLWVKGDEGDTRILHFKGNPSTWEGVWQTQNKVRDAKALPAFANTHNDGIDRKSDELINTFTYEQACQDRGPLEDTKTADTLPIPKAFYTTWGKMRADYLAEYDKYVGMTPAPGGNVTVAHKEFWTKLCRKQKGGEAILPYTPAASLSDERFLLLRDMLLADKQDLKGLVPFKAGTPEEKRTEYIAKRWAVADPRTGRFLGFDQIHIEISPAGKTVIVYVATFDMTFIMPNMPALDKEIYRNLGEVIEFVKAYDPDLDVTYPQGAYTSPTSFPVRRTSKPSWIVLSRNFNALNESAPTARKPQSMTLSEWARAN
jgi:hypothetical protein